MEPRDIAHFSGISRAAVSSVLNTLEREGLVERRRESDDRRLVTVHLTESGQQGMLGAYEQQNKVEQDVFGGMSRADLRTYVTQLQGLLARRPNEDGTA
jgi:DNA-binding MarR family transcriptional regulator